MGYEPNNSSIKNPYHIKPITQQKERKKRKENKKAKTKLIIYMHFLLVKETLNWFSKKIKLSIKNVYKNYIFKDKY
jgi:hypothetical protein